MSIDIDVTNTLASRLSDALQHALQQTDLARFMAHVELTILQRTAKGEFLPGSSPEAEEYSTTPFARPAGGLSQDVQDAADSDRTVASYFTNDDDLWLVFEGGYKALRALQGLKTDTVDLFVSGDMLQGLRSKGLRRSDGTLRMEVGYIKGMSPARAIELANYHNRLGAGKSKTIRKFVGLTDEELADLIDTMEADLKRRMRL